MNNEKKKKENNKVWVYVHDQFNVFLPFHIRINRNINPGDLILIEIKDVKRR